MIQGDTGLSPVEIRALSREVKGLRFWLPALRTFKILFSNTLRKNSYIFKEAVSGTTKH